MNWAKQQYQRTEGLAGAGVVSKQDLDQAKATLDAAQAQMDALDAQVREQEVQLRYYKVTAPRGGIVGDIPVRVGDRVTNATQLTTVDQPGSLEAYVYVPVERSAQLKMNLPVQILDSNGKVLADTRISFISPQVDNTTQTVLVKARIANGNDALAAVAVHSGAGGVGDSPEPGGADSGGVAARGTVLCVRGGTTERRVVRGEAETSDNRRDRGQ